MIQLTGEPVLGLEPNTELVVGMSEGVMKIGSFKTTGFRLYSLILIALLGYIIAAILNIPGAAGIQTVLIFLLGSFAVKKA